MVCRYGRPQFQKLHNIHLLIYVVVKRSSFICKDWSAKLSRNPQFSGAICRSWSLPKLSLFFSTMLKAIEMFLRIDTIEYSWAFGNLQQKRIFSNMEKASKTVLRFANFVADLKENNCSDCVSTKKSKTIQHDPSDCLKFILLELMAVSRSIVQILN